jgi:hypothetical protein
MYSSADLLNWTPLGAQASIDQMWRPKYARPNGEFWVCFLLLYFGFLFSFVVVLFFDSFFFSPALCIQIRFEFNSNLSLTRYTAK